MDSIIADITCKIINEFQPILKQILPKYNWTLKMRYPIQILK